MNEHDQVRDLVCFSHLRWDFVYQRPQHLLSRCAKKARVFFFEEPIFTSGIMPHLAVSPREDLLRVAVPHLPTGMSEEDVIAAQRRFVDELITEHALTDYSLWFYTPMALPFAKHLKPEAVVYDCMDELSAFKNAPAVLKERERDLLTWSHVVFTGGQSLYEARRHSHPNIHAFPSSVDVAHFAQARTRSNQEEAADQAGIPHPRLGFFGVIDERMDIDLVRQIAEMRPDWHLVMVGPVVKIDPATLPTHPNIHYLGSKTYAELPHYIAGWDIALLPFARNESTRFISPTKTPEYLAAGKPVISTPIPDVVHPYGEQRLVHIAEDAAGFVCAADSIFAKKLGQDLAWRKQVDEHLSTMSWDETWRRMHQLMTKGRSTRTSRHPAGTRSFITAA